MPPYSVALKRSNHQNVNIFFIDYKKCIGLGLLYEAYGAQDIAFEKALKRSKSPKSVVGEVRRT